MAKKLQEIKLRFNIFDTGREYTGKQRGYILDNVKQVINSPIVQERLRLREAVGYVGHGLREMAGQLTLGEKCSVKMPNGQMMVVDAIPSNVMTDISIDEDGWIEHTQEVLDNAEGKKLLGLHNSKIGGFSWASAGGKINANTIISDLMGFDYVHNPLFSSNRGYVLDSAEGEMSDIFDREMVLDNLTAAGIENADEANMVLDSFVASAVFEASQYREQLFASQQIIADQHEKHIEQSLLLDSATAEVEQHKEAAKTREQLLGQLQQSCQININDQVLDALVNMSTAEHVETVKNLILDAAKINVSHLPIGTQKPAYVRSQSEVKEEPQFGDLEYSLNAGMYD